MMSPATIFATFSTHGCSQSGTVSSSPSAGFASSRNGELTTFTLSPRSALKPTVSFTSWVT